jgi:hypothetical protein
VSGPWIGWGCFGGLANSLVIGLWNSVIGCMRLAIYTGRFTLTLLISYKPYIFILHTFSIASSANPLVTELKHVLRRGFNDLIDDTEELCTLVDDLQDEASELTHVERRFLDYLIPFRDKLVRDALVITSVECAEALSQTTLAVILDKSWDKIN